MEILKRIIKSYVHINRIMLDIKKLTNGYKIIVIYDSVEEGIIELKNIDIDYIKSLHIKLIELHGKFTKDEINRFSFNSKTRIIHNQQ